MLQTSPAVNVTEVYVLCKVSQLLTTAKVTTEDELRAAVARGGEVVVRAGATIELKPLGTHIMLTGLKSAIKADEPFAGTLVFERAGTLDVTFAVQGLGAPAPGGNEHEGHMQ